MHCRFILIIKNYFGCYFFQNKNEIEYKNHLYIYIHIYYLIN